MTFRPSTYANFVAEDSRGRERLFLQYLGHRDDFDVIIVGSGIGGGILADDLAERIGSSRRILVLEAGSFVYPTHVYNLCRFPNAALARHFGCDTFWQAGTPDDQFFIGEKPQLAFGGRSIFWSGLIPTIQPWELEFFPSRVRHDLAGGLLAHAGALMNESRSMGAAARAIVAALRSGPLADDFSIEETPRALHQPYLTPDGEPHHRSFVEPTGVFNTAELLINQAGLTPGVSHGDGPGLHLLLHHYVEDVQNHGGHLELVVRNTLNGQMRVFRAGRVVLACGSIESPKLLRRSSIYPWLPPSVKDLLGRGLTDHPTTSEMTAYVTHIGPVAIPKSVHAKIILYSRGRPDPSHPDQIRYPFNVELNINHEYWHLRDNDPNDPNRTDPDAFSLRDPAGPSRLDLKFSFGNCLDDVNEIRPAPPFEYVPEVRMRNLKWMDHLRDSRFPALAGWRKDYDAIFEVLNRVTSRICSQFTRDGAPAAPADGMRYGAGGRGFGWGTVHHAAGSLRMPYRASHTGPFEPRSVVDEALRVVGAERLYVCDMSVMPFSSAANPVRTLAALALRLSKHLG
jgi:choline dehydrogenase-like flavoprotein